MDKSSDFIKSLHLGGEKVILGCSGGPDSMCLLDLLVDNGVEVVCAHVDHNIREVSASEYDFVKSFCQERGIPFEGIHLPKQKKDEAFYRRERYKFYKILAQKYHTSYIATAHHGDDLVETVLMRITRGSRLQGYAGFREYYEEDAYVFIKPLIYYTKNDILAYVKNKQIPYVLDSSNEDDNYTRNRYRHYVLPFLKREDEHIIKKYYRFSQEISEANRVIDEVVKHYMNENCQDDAIDVKKFVKMDEYLQKRELELILFDIYKDDVDKLKVFHIHNIIQKLKDGKNFSCNLPCGYIVKREYGYLRIEQNAKTDDYNILFDEYAELPDGSTIEKVENSQDTSNYTVRLNSRELCLPLYIRNKRIGDVLEVKNLKGHKKIKSIFIDEKVPPRQRGSYPLLVDANDTVLWLPGLKKSKFDVNKDEKYDIILKYTKRKGKNL